MKPKSILLKILILLPFLLFIDWIVMVLFGCVASICGAGENFYCSVFCKTGIVLLSLTALLIVVWPIYRIKKVGN